MLFGRFWLSDTVPGAPIPGIHPLPQLPGSAAGLRRLGEPLLVLPQLQRAGARRPAAGQGRGWIRPSGSCWEPAPASPSFLGAPCSMPSCPQVSRHPRHCCRTVAVPHGTDPLSAQVTWPRYLGALAASRTPNPAETPNSIKPKIVPSSRTTLQSHQNTAPGREPAWQQDGDGCPTSHAELGTVP